MNKPTIFGIMALMLLSLVSVTSATTNCDPYSTSNVCEPGTNPKDCTSVYKYVKMMEKKYLNDNAATYTTQNTYNSGSSGIGTRTLSYYLVGDYDFLPDNDYSEYLNQNYVTRAEYDNLKYQLGQWQSNYYKLLLRVAALENK